MVAARLARTRAMTPVGLYEVYHQSRERARSERVLAAFALQSSERFVGRVLVDAMWDNPNYWIRYTLLRAALGLAHAQEVGVLGPYRARICRRTLERLGISTVVSMTALTGPREADGKEACRLLARTTSPEDVLGWELPHGLPPDFVYDGILKRQQAACVDLTDPRLPGYVAEAIGSIRAADELLTTHRFDLVVLSHAVNFQFAALAWLAIRRDIPVILAYGHYGVPRFVRLMDAPDMYDTTDRPVAGDLDMLPEYLARAMAEAGVAYLKRRHAGQTDDIGARYAFQKPQWNMTRTSMIEFFRWSSDRPIIAVYASNWFDFPHPCGMAHFRDFLDWLEATVAAAVANDRVNWLFKAHPCDAWYGGVTLRDLMPKSSQRHVRLAEGDWNGSSLLDCTDGVVTYHGTAAVEFAASGKPVLVADRGWYHDAGFVKWPRSRNEYLEALATDWWKELNLEVTTRRARLFAGWYFCRPAWQGGFVLEDDSVQWPIYARVPRLFADNPEPFRREVDTIRAWFHSDSRHYHTFKMRRAEEFRP